MTEEEIARQELLDLVRATPDEDVAAIDGSLTSFVRVWLNREWVTAIATEQGLAFAITDAGREVVTQWRATLK